MDFWLTSYELQKQPSRGVLRKRCSENMQQIDRRTPMPKRDFNKVTKQIHTSAWVFSYKFAAYFPNIFVLEHLLMAASGVASYELRVAIYCTSYVLLFTYELRVITYCTIYELIFTYELRVTIYCTSHELNLSHGLRVTIYCTS